MDLAYSIFDSRILDLHCVNQLFVAAGLAIQLSLQRLALFVPPHVPTLSSLLSMSLLHLALLGISSPLTRFSPRDC